MQENVKSCCWHVLLVKVMTCRRPWQYLAICTRHVTSRHVTSTAVHPRSLGDAFDPLSPSKHSLPHPATLEDAKGQRSSSVRFPLIDKLLVTPAVPELLADATGPRNEGPLGSPKRLGALIEDSSSPHRQQEAASKGRQLAPASRHSSRARRRENTFMRGQRSHVSARASGEGTECGGRQRMADSFDFAHERMAWPF